MKHGGAGSLFAGAQVADSVPLAPMTTIRIGPVARRVITCATSDQVVAVLRQLDAPQAQEAQEAPETPKPRPRRWCLPGAPTF